MSQVAEARACTGVFPRARTGSAPQPRHQVGSLGIGAEKLARKARVGEVLGEELLRGTLVAGRVDGVEADQLAQQVLRLDATLCALLSLHAHRADDRTPISATSSRVSGKWHAVSVSLPLSSSSGSSSLHSCCALGQRV